MKSSSAVDENAVRAGWQTGAHCQIYSNSKKKWFHGEVAQIFTDEEGEWLEVRYANSMSKQVQRYSSDIRPHPDDLKRKKRGKHKTNDTGFNQQETKNQFAEQERQVRQSWIKGDEVEIFSNTHQEWYLGEVVDIIKDDEGEWLTCVWARGGNEAMSKQVQRFSTDVRPVQKDEHTDSSSDSDSEEGLISSNNKHSNKQQTEVEKKKILAQQIANRKTNFRRRAPLFSRTLRTSTFTYPASKMARQTRKLNDLEEALETNQHVADAMPAADKKKQTNGKRIDIESMKPGEVGAFIRSFGSAYERYAKRFMRMKGTQLLKQNEMTLQRIGVTQKLHRNKILLEIHRHSPGNQYQSIFSNEIEVLNWSASKVEEWCSATPVMSTYAKKLFNHGVNGMLLFELDAKDLSVIGVKKAHQSRILDIIQKFGRQNFATVNDDEKDEESSKNGMDVIDLSNSDGSGKKKRGSVAHIDVSKLQQNGNINNIAAAPASNQNNDAIIYTMGELLLELGQMFKVGKVQDLTTRLAEQLNELQRNSNHPQMLKRESQNLSVEVSMNSNSNEHDRNGGAGSSPNANNSNAASLIKKMQDTVDTSPTGVDAAWIKTQNQAKGHKRRSSLPFINANQLENDDEDEEDISDIE